MIQSNYLPWKGYFDIIAAADAFVLYDTVQYTRHDWRNRNRVKTREGLKWLTVPVRHAPLGSAINTIEIDEHAWLDRHKALLRQSYGRTTGFEWAIETLFGLADLPDMRLSTLNERLIRSICKALGITTSIHRSEALPHGGSATQKILDICQALGATRYLSGPAAKDYLDASLFDAAGIGLEWFDYSGYRTYEQPWGPFEHQVSIVDLLCCCGPDAPGFMKMGAR